MTKNIIILSGNDCSGSALVASLLKVHGFYFGKSANKDNFNNVVVSTYLSMLIDNPSLAGDMLSFVSPFVKNFISDYGEHDNICVKCEESQMLIPFLSRLFPDAKFILFVRNGIDNAILSNDFNYKYIPIFFKGCKITEKNYYFMAARLWLAITRMAISHGGKYYGKKKFRVFKLEHFCHSDKNIIIDSIHKLYRFVDVGEYNIDKGLLSQISPKKTAIGIRYLGVKNKDGFAYKPKNLFRMEMICYSLLKKLRYIL